MELRLTEPENAGFTWEAAEIAILRERYATTPGAELSHLLGRSRNAVQIQAHRLGLRRGPENRSTPASQAYGLRRRGIVFSAEHRAKLSAAKKRRRGAVADGEPPRAA